MKSKTLIIIILTSILASSCCRSKEETRWDLTEAEKQLIPYELGQTINFIDSVGNPFVLTVTENSSRWHYYFIESHERCENYVSINRKTVRLKSDTYNLTISLWINDYSYTSKNEYLTFLITPFGCYFDIRYHEGGQFSMDDYQNVYDSLIVNNKTYYEVVEKIEASRSILYNKTDGILQVCDKNKELFSIIK